MHLIGFVIPGQCVHHNVDPSAKCHLTLFFAARHSRVQASTAFI